MKVTAIIRFKHSAIYQARKELGYSQKELAEKIGISQSALATWENFRSCPSKKDPRAQSLCQIVGKSYNELFPEEFRQAVYRKQGRSMEVEFKTKRLPEWVERNLLLPDPEEQYILKERKDKLKECIQEALKFLTERERRVLILKFGLYGNPVHTLEEIGRMFDLSKGRIYQIEAKALRKLKRLSRKEALKVIYES